VATVGDGGKDEVVIIKNDDLLKTYRIPGICRWCGRRVRQLCACHIFPRGRGRVDLPFNLVAMGADALTDCKCHHDSHLTGFPGESELLALNAVSFGVSQDTLKRLYWWILRLDKRADKDAMRRRLGELSDEVHRLAVSQLEL